MPQPHPNMMPQLQPDTWPPQLVWLAITFGILYWLMLKIALPRIGGVIDARRSHLRRDLDQAEMFRNETQASIAAYEQAMAEAKQKAHAIVQAGREKMNQEVAAERATLERELAAKAAEAEARIHQAKSSALREVNRIAEEVATDIVRRLIGIAPAQAEIAEAVSAARKE